MWGIATIKRAFLPKPAPQMGGVLLACNGHSHYTFSTGSNSGMTKINVDYFGLPLYWVLPTITR